MISGLLPDPRRSCAAQLMHQHHHTASYSLLLEPGLVWTYPWHSNPAPVWAGPFPTLWLCSGQCCWLGNGADGATSDICDPVRSLCLILFLLQVIQIYIPTEIPSSPSRNTAELWSQTKREQHFDSNASGLKKLKDLRDNMCQAHSLTQAEIHWVPARSWASWALDTLTL